MECLEEKRQFIQDFERAINIGKAKAYSNISLERPLTEEEFQEYKKIMEGLK